MKNKTTTYKGFTPPTPDQMKRFRELEKYDIYTHLDGKSIHIKTTDKNLFNLYLNDEMTEKDTRLVMYQFEEWERFILEIFKREGMDV